jgi:hypothetical protein
MFALGLPYLELLLLLLLLFAAVASSGTLAAIAIKVMFARPAADTSVAKRCTSGLTKLLQLAMLLATLGTVAKPFALLLLLLGAAPPPLD